EVSPALLQKFQSSSSATASAIPSSTYPPNETQSPLRGHEMLAFSPSLFSDIPGSFTSSVTSSSSSTLSGTSSSTMTSSRYNPDDIDNDVVPSMTAAPNQISSLWSARPHTSQLSFHDRTINTQSISQTQ